MLAGMAGTEELKQLRMADLFNKLRQRGQQIQVIYMQGHWLDVDDLKDLSDASAFRGVSE